MLPAQQHYTLALIPQLECIYFCPDMNGLICYRVTRNNVIKLADHTGDDFLEEKFRYRKPGAGMIYQAVFDFDIDLTKSWMIGDRDEDEKAAKAAGLSFMPAEIWHMRFTPRHLLQAGEPVQRSGSGMYEIRDARGLANASLSATPQQVKFLEGVNLN